MVALASLSSPTARRVWSRRFALSNAIAAWSASDDSSATSSAPNSRVARSDANSTPSTFGPIASGTPRIAVRPSSLTPESMCRVCRNRSSLK
jgi:hypothetical protein